MENSKALEIWVKTWKPDVHTTDYASKRIKSAKSSKLTPLKIDITDCYGYFQGSHGRYETWLDHCPCGDFIRSKLPCKHIYRLAIELGLLGIEAEYNPNAIVTPRNERISLDETIDMVESLSENAQHKLLHIASNIRTTTPTYQVGITDDIIELLNSGIVIDAAPETHGIRFGTKNEICKLLDREGISYNKKAKKNELTEICVKNVPEKAKIEFGETTNVGIPDKFSPQKIHYYLHRKYNSELYYDEKMALLKVPLLDTDLPDDAVTEQLIKRGYYSRNKAVTL